jgi:hypothetical protein
VQFCTAEHHLSAGVGTPETLQPARVITTLNLKPQTPKPSHLQGYVERPKKREGTPYSLSSQFLARNV